MREGAEERHITLFCALTQKCKMKSNIIIILSISAGDTESEVMLNQGVGDIPRQSGARGAGTSLSLLSMSPALSWRLQKGDIMSTFKCGNHWRWNDRATINLFKNRLRSIMNQRRISATRLAEFIGQSVSNVSYYMSGSQIPPSDIQELIALYLGRNNRAEIWEFRRDLFPELKQLRELNSQITKIETVLHKKVEDGLKCTK